MIMIGHVASLLRLRCAIKIKSVFDKSLKEILEIKKKKNSKIIKQIFVIRTINTIIKI